MSELKPCPKCTKCNGGSKTELVNTVDGVFFKCLWCEELSELSFNDIGSAFANKIKAEGARSILDLDYDVETPNGGDAYSSSTIEDHANKLERGEL